ncbi:RNA polymerase sigma factor [uncultured Oscillibacter sp.]|uniref:RNA polymerase sigma factor n=1 Tax=uncultured Oscillibacter sp. TaxID=876091 RepID=UPI00216F5F78|nr:sigma-70 family RNA polymerase sigma factor [uncultured Oscillibacter sp.]MCI9554942.1 sigma-70 family RNA polymerase sigma factor [Oscillibacter sp.]
MEDHAIVDLYWSRNPEAIQRTGEKYGSYCRAVAWNILADRRDAEECVNDTWLGAWNAIPENRPHLLAPFLGKITRNLAFTRWRASRAEKRGGGELPLVLEELEECASSDNPLQAVEAAELEAVVNRFLHTLPERERNVFLRRYWFTEPMADIARRYGMREPTVRSSLFRSREKLRHYLEKEGLL